MSLPTIILKRVASSLSIFHFILYCGQLFNLYFYQLNFTNNSAASWYSQFESMYILNKNNIKLNLQKLKFNIIWASHLKTFFIKSTPERGEPEPDLLLKKMVNPVGFLFHKSFPIIELG